MAGLTLTPNEIALCPRLNLGCGQRTHRDWINADLNPADPSIHSIDARKPLPFPDDSLDAIYHAHTLEHLTPDEGAALMNQCARVLKPGGVLRVTVPDLETIARNYLSNLQLALQGDQEAEKRYDWTILELIDQLVRTRPGGRMLRCWAQEDVPAERFIIERMGDEYTHTRNAIQNHRSIHGEAPEWASGSPDASSAAEQVEFRKAGEVHKWMYDRFSVTRMLLGAGFVEPQLQKPTESLITDWDQFELESSSQGRPYKPDSIAIEATTVV